MASKGASSRAAARKQKDKWKAKRWYTIRAPRQPWHFKVIGETLGEEDELLIGRMYEITQQEVDGDFSKMHVKLKFRVTEIIGQDAITEFAGHEVLKDRAGIWEGERCHDRRLSQSGAPLTRKLVCWGR